MQIFKNFYEKYINSKKVAPYIFVSPFILVFLVFYLYPIISTVIMSFQEIGFGEAKFIGLANYKKLFNVHYKNALLTSTNYTFWTILILVPLPIILAVFLNSDKTKFTNFFRSSIFMPALTSVIVAGMFFRYAFGEQASTLANSIIGIFGLEPITWLQNYIPAMIALVVLCVWRWLGVNIIYFLSGLQSIPEEIYEAADIDGANSWDKFKYITIPSLKPVIIYVITISVFGGYKMFAESYAYWQTATPNDIGMTIVSYIYQTGFNNFNMGFASAIGITLLLIVLVVNIIQLNIFGLFKKEEQ
ncbi:MULTISPECIES: carbohydrate ABC transporter permease [Halanaerobium]|uniref:L-arabinose ABC transporter membrane protein n=1 Tax=Halanaerobium kushneri TaxID=56779 RepID=A0A1N6Z908_9FIRM|nr:MULTISPECIES: sugar ABC transporter permease [Halanaerobium]RCW61902.1 L-arabinose ABC transporter membrane protein [Halanaerobium sp. ST460_2HS_T2]SIR23382.1 L-arabinose ABC transporter membrane protein [Halanaerobium kushneri]